MLEDKCKQNGADEPNQNRHNDHNSKSGEDDQCCVPVEFELSSLAIGNN
jgi:hypothetical protein